MLRLKLAAFSVATTVAAFAGAWSWVRGRP
jgi:hypothetical protein